MALVYTICILTSLVVTSVVSKNTTHVFTVTTMDGETKEYSYKALDSSECLYNGRLRKSVCMDDYSYSDVSAVWKNKPQLIQYVNVNCKLQENVSGARASCICKAAASPNAVQEKFYACHLETIKADLFNRTNDLELIDLSDNKIQSIDRSAFLGLDKVKYISLNNNNGLMRVPFGIFCEVPSLEYLGLSGLYLDVFPSHAFVCKANLTQLAIIDLSNSNMKDVPVDSMSHLPSLKFLDLSGNHLVQIYKASFSGGRSLQHLDLSNNNLAYLFPHFCDYLPDLTYLHLRGNNLTSFSFDEMAGCSALLSLDLSHSNMASLVGNASTFASLQMFDISSNNLLALEVKLNSQPGLRTFNMSHNQFSKFDTDTFHRLENLRTLDIAANAINFTDNFEQLFESLKSLEYLDLQENKMMNIPNNSFSNMVNLTSLFLSHNEISTLYPASFSGLALVTRLSLDFNDLESLPEGIFDPLTALKHLTLSNNRLVSLAVLASQSLVSLDVSKNALGSFPSSLKFAEMETLNVSHNNLETFIASAENAFVLFKSLSILDLSFNNISDISRSVFSTCHNLTYLSLENNNLHRNLTSESFAGANVLSSLNLAGNEISEIGKLFDIGSSLNSLKQLNLSNNPLNIIRKLATSDVLINTTIESIDLSGCNISVLDPFTFTNMSRLRYVFLKNNNIKTFHPFLATPTTKYDMTGNPLHCSCDMLWIKEPYYEFPASNGNTIKISVLQFKLGTCSIYRETGTFLPELLFRKQFLCPEVENCSPQCACFKARVDSDISVVDCSNRSLTRVPTVISPTALSIYFDGSDFSGPDALSAFTTFTDTMSATELYLNRCDIRSLNSSMFSSFGNLEILQLSLNALQILPVGIFDHLPSMNELILSGNQLTTIETGVFKYENLTDLKLLDLSYNTLEIMSEESASELTSLNSTRFVLGHNPWACNCSNLNFKTFVSERRQSINDWQSLICKQTGQQIMYVPRTDFVCYVEAEHATRHSGTIIALIFTGVALLIVIAVSYYFRRELLSILYYYIGCHIPSRSQFPGMHFDAFICYNPNEQHSSEYLENVLMPKLQNNGFNVQTSGDLIPDIEITKKAIEDSRCSLFIVNKNFSSNSFLLSVFHAAQAISDSERRHNVILLIHGDVDLYALEPEMLKHLRKGDYVTARSRVWWQRLVYEFPMPSGHRVGAHECDNVSESDVIVFSTLENDTYESI